MGGGVNAEVLGEEIVRRGADFRNDLHESQISYILHWRERDGRQAGNHGLWQRTDSMPGDLTSDGKFAKKGWTLYKASLFTFFRNKFFLD